MDSKTLAIRYGGRVGGALLAWRAFGHKGGTWGAVAAVALGWVAGGFAADMVAERV